MNRFDEGVNREGTNSVKWDEREHVFGRADVIPVWVADMDFAAPDEVIEAMVKRAQHGAFGYTTMTDEDYQAVIDWMKRRHDADVARDAIMISPGVVDTQRIALSAVTQPGDKVIISTPVYGPFFGSAEFAKCQQCLCTMLQTDDGWRMDFNAIEDAMKAGAKAYLLCNPHNPVGRVWSEAELKTLVGLAKKYGVQIISDEIHADIEMPGYKNTSLLKVDPEAIVAISATKTFNLAALRHSTLIIPDKDLRDRVKARFASLGVGGSNLFGQLATTAAYKYGDKWLDECCAYMDGTRQYVEDFVHSQLPMIKVSRLEGTYLMWLDMRALGMEADDLYQFMIKKAGVGFSNGTGFGDAGKGFMRLNIATPRRNIVRAMEQVKAAIDTL